MEEQAVRWTVRVSKETDLILRTFLGSQGMRKGDLSKFIEDPVRWRVFNKTVQDIKAKNAGSSVDDLQKLIDETSDEVRTERRKSEVGTTPAARLLVSLVKSQCRRKQCRRLVSSCRLYI